MKGPSVARTVHCHCPGAWHAPVPGSPGRESAVPAGDQQHGHRATARTAGAPLGCTVICRPAEQRAAPEARGDRAARRHVPDGPAPGISRAVPSGPLSGRKSWRRGFAGEVYAALCAALCQLAVTRERLDRAQRDRARLAAGVEAAEQATAWKRNRPAVRGPAAGRSSQPIGDADGYRVPRPARRAGISRVHGRPAPALYKLA
jgi:hypothetical protein